MLDIKFIRENPEAVRQGAKAKNISIDLDPLLQLDAQRRTLQQKLQDLTTEQNRLSRDLGPLMGRIKAEKDPQIKSELEAQAQALRQKPAELKQQSAVIEEELKKLEPKIDELMLTIPLPPDSDVPVGKSAEDNVELRRWGTVRKFDFKPLSHVELGERLSLFDVQRGVKLAGSRSYFLTGAGALLHQAVLRLALDLMVFEKGFKPLTVPVLVREAAMRGTGFFPAGREQAYRVGEINETGEDERFLTGTGEVGLTAWRMDEILDHAELPLKLVTVSTCFRREAGTYGKDTSGLYRIHQFDKVEQVVICQNDRDESIRWHKEMLANSELVLQRLNLPYRIMQCCTGDLGPKNASMIDIETWMPSRNAYGETHSASRLYDFQARRCNLRYKTADGKTLFCHTLNNTVIASPRILIPILELYQNADGSVKVPEALRTYMKGMDVIGA
ncbi:MAG TPA: serine--tRNA ligase [Phycisphaerae bacterium]|nr:serine--tRNA ligase [Phycisphaerae bacterium]